MLLWPKLFDARAAARQHAIDREFIQHETDFPGPQCFKAAFEFLERNCRAERWFLEIECFDPHQPFHAPARFKRDYETGYNGGILDGRTTRRSAMPTHNRSRFTPEDGARPRAPRGSTSPAGGRCSACHEGSRRGAGRGRSVTGRVRVVTNLDLRCGADSSGCAGSLRECSIVPGRSSRARLSGK